MVKYVFAFNVQAPYLFGCHCHVKYMQFKHIFEKPTCNHHPNRIHTHTHLCEYGDNIDNDAM